MSSDPANLSNPKPEGGDADDRGPREPTPDPDVTPGESGPTPWCAHCGGTWPCRNPRCLRPRRSHAKRLPDTPDSPEPSDPDTDHQPAPDPSMEPGEFVFETSAEEATTYNPQWMPPDEDPEPADDLWERIEDGSVWRQRAILDLRERVTKTENSGGWAGILATRSTELERRLNTLEKEMRHRVTKVERRVESLEGHADRGNEAEAELRGRVELLEAEDRSALEARRHLLDEVEKLWRIEERVEALEREQGRREDYEMEQRELEE